MIVILYAIAWLTALGFGVGVIAARRADHAALNLMGVMVAMAANFLIMGYQFIGFLQIIVYVGAIMVLFLFVIMLLNLRQPEPSVLSKMGTLQRTGLWMGVFLFALLAAFVIFGAIPEVEVAQVEASSGMETVMINGAEVPLAERDTSQVTPMAAELLEKWLIPFEVTSLLLLASVIGAIYIARQRPIITIDLEAPQS